MSFCTKKLEQKKREEFSLCIWIKSYLFFIHLPGSFSRSLTLCYVLLPKKVDGQLFFLCLQILGAITVWYFKAEFLTSGCGCPVHSWTGTLETICCVCIFFPWGGSRVNVSSSKESGSKKGYELFCAHMNFQEYLSPREYQD